MQIHDDHLHHGAALIQIAEHPQFTAINSLKQGRKVISVAYKVNDEIAVYLKYASKPTQAYKEYTFTFNTDQVSQVAEIAAANPKTFVALICVKDREICCISYGQLQDLIERRKKAKGGAEDQYVILVTASKGKSLRVYVNVPGKRNKLLGDSLIVSRKAFPDGIFG